jgi:pimeloyl-ACP methyl ester carboxylesterase
MVASSFSWRHLVPELVTRYRVLSIDAVAHGESVGGESCDYCLAGHARRLLEVLDALNIESCTCVATSYGGAVALQAASMQQGRFGRLILVAPAHPFASQPIFVASAYSTLIGRAVAHTYPYLPVPLFRWGLSRMYADSGKCSIQVAGEYQRSIRHRGHISGILRTVRAYGQDMAELRRQIHSLGDTPVRLIWGECDPVIPLPSAKALILHLPTASLRTLPRLGHLPYEEDAREFAAAVNQSLAD